MKLLILLLSLFLINKTFAANSKIYGTVTDSLTTKPMEYVTIQLYSYTDTTFLAGTVTNELGQFAIEKIEFGNYYAKLNYLGYNTYVIENITINKESNIYNFENIKMQANQNLLNEVTVTGEKRVLEFDINKQVINFTDDIVKTSTDISDILIKSPSITKSGSDNVLLRGSSSYKVLLDGKPTNDNSILFEIPLNTIQKIEIITSPSANYDAEGKAGIINIVSKKQYFNGYSASISGYVFSNQKYKLSPSFYYKKGKFSLFANCTLKSLNSKNIKDKTLTMLSNNYSFFSTTTDKRLNNNLNTSLKTDYKLNNNNVLSFSTRLTRNLVYYDFKTNSKTINNNLLNYSSSQDNHLWDVTNYNFLLDYTHTFKNGGTFDNYIYTENINDVLTDTLNSYKTKSNYIDKISNLSALNNIQNKNSKYLVYNADYNLTFKEKYTFATGFKFSKIDFNGSFNVENFDSLTNAWNTNNYFTNQPIYARNIFAEYINFSGSLQGFNYMLGLRCEYSDRLLTYLNRSDIFSNKKLDFFPSFSLSKDIGIHSLQMSFSRRITRPGYEALNIAPMFYDINDVYIGSPYLKPEYSNAIDLGYSFYTQKINFFSQFYFSLAKDYFLDYNIIGENTLRSIKNGAKNNDYGLNIGINYMPTNWLSFNLNQSLGFGNSTDNTDLGEVKENNFLMNTYLYTSINLKTNTIISLSTSYSPEMIQLYYKMDKSYFLSLSVSQDFWKQKANIELSIDNVFRDNFGYTLSDSQNSMHFKTKTQYPVFILNFSLKLNNFKNKQLRTVTDDDYSGGGIK